MGIRQLASELNLSVSTISRALNDSDEVSAEIRERVRAAALQHGYAPSKLAESLRKGRLDIIGLMLPMRREEENYTLGVFMTMADGLHRSCPSTGWISSCTRANHGKTNSPACGVSSIVAMSTG